MTDHTDESGRAKPYRLLCCVIAAEIVIAAICGNNGLTIENKLPGGLLVLAFFAPIELLLWLKSRDEDTSHNVKRLCSAAFWFIIISFCAGALLPVFSKLYACADAYSGF